MSLKNLVENNTSKKEVLVNTSDKQDIDPNLIQKIDEELEVMSNLISNSFVYILGALHAYAKFNALNIPKQEDFEKYIVDMRTSDVSLELYLSGKKDTISTFLKWFYGIS